MEDTPMTFQEFLASIGLTTTSFWGIVVFLMSIGIEIIPKIKWSPWSALFKYIGSKFNDRIDQKIDGVNSKIDTVDKKINQVNSELKAHITESEKKALEDTRRDILDFCNACMNKRKHTQEQFKFVMKQCDSYETYIETNHIKNGEISAAIEEIRRIYKQCLRENSFLKEGES
jgi:chaperonin cofactor prefoldin